MLTTGRAIFRNVALQNWRAGGGDGSRNLRTVARGNFRRQASNTWSATYQSTKQAFESHRAVFTIGTSILSILTAWAGYSIRHIHETKVEKRLGSMEEAMKKNYHVEEEIKKVVGSGNAGTTACMATAGTSLMIGSGNVSTTACIAAAAWTSLIIGCSYYLGWCGGSRFASRNFRREQLKLMGQIKPNRWQFFRRPFVRLKSPRTVKKRADLPPSSNSPSLPSKQCTNHAKFIISEFKSWFTVNINK